MKTQPKTIVITGASSGIGLALAGAYLQRGDNVVGNARSAERLQQASVSLGSPDNFLGVAGDVADPVVGDLLVRRAIERFGHVDVLVNNAGFFNAKQFIQYTPDELEALVSTNLKGFVYPSQAAVRHMVERKAGHIISITASLASQPNQAVPAVLPLLIKGGINQATKALALELAPHNIQVTAVAPGIVDTPMYTKEMHGFLNTLQPAGRIGTVQEIVDAVLYLSDASFTTGIVLPVDGGMGTGKW
ncbi:NAD(P)-dependent dehydrogenase, short-chain alcohol dehydrogenase family [Variovorax sp. YR634]|jgi:NAD(P)-dependent dehydrogenase (short-subunit alcohol dehydrogenase family)|uniref:SDR family NAD(P)-dependent oxidoreductase n=1 Tax=Variovorax TaxID=34072 RepID=UPI00089D9FD4|nr:SDR family NAD(P)-dependent oxidoreductase [Variovorax sp. YR634]SDW19061.1 NAD(P)-dependent dehydrogenase, short-chain alcohol dehydrogenase family [Variovorax sp. YR634]